MVFIVENIPLVGRKPVLIPRWDVAPTYVRKYVETCGAMYVRRFVASRSLGSSLLPSNNLKGGGEPAYSADTEKNKRALLFFLF